MNIVERERERVQYFPNFTTESFFTDHLLRLFSITRFGKVYYFSPSLVNLGSFISNDLYVSLVFVYLILFFTSRHFYLESLGTIMYKNTKTFLKLKYS